MISLIRCDQIRQKPSLTSFPDQKCQHVTFFGSIESPDKFAHLLIFRHNDRAGQAATSINETSLPKTYCQKFIN
jgi:hypothetical protein